MPEWDAEIVWSREVIVVIPFSPGWNLRLSTPHGTENGMVRVVAYGPAGETNCADYTGEHCGVFEHADEAFACNETVVGIRMGWAPPGTIEKMPEHEGW